MPDSTQIISRVAGGERLTASMAVGGLLCLAAIAAVSMPSARPEDPEDQDTRGPNEARSRPATSRLLGLGYGAAGGVGFGLFFLCLRNAGQSGVLWPVAVSRGAPACS